MPILYSTWQLEHPGLLKDVPAPMGGHDRRCTCPALDVAIERIDTLAALDHGLTRYSHLGHPDGLSARHVPAMRAEWRPPDENVVGNLFALVRSFELAHGAGGARLSDEDLLRVAGPFIEAHRAYKSRLSRSGLLPLGTQPANDMALPYTQAHAAARPTTKAAIRRDKRDLKQADWCSPKATQIEVRRVVNKMINALEKAHGQERKESKLAKRKAESGQREDGALAKRVARGCLPPSACDADGIPKDVRKVVNSLISQVEFISAARRKRERHAAAAPAEPSTSTARPWATTSLTASAVPKEVRKVVNTLVNKVEFTVAQERKAAHMAKICRIGGGLGV